ncbi:MAG: Dam family site-specific DNA-(adenine-N6)-methyltransferase [Planctomycetaceae bacterium]|nr:Dam family site-specific DNA-(adenine-N6)-methyltransferase [Planctomycetaceae bacterium]
MTKTGTRRWHFISSRRVWASPLLRWAGSKRKLLPHLLASIPETFNRYVEPFAGSGCLFFALRPKHAVLGDINHELIDAYEVIRRHPRRVSRAVACLGTEKQTYYELRSADPTSLAAIDRAARFVYLNRHCFNGVYRINRAGAFNVPRGTRTGQVPTERQFYRCSVALRSAELRPVGYRDCLSDLCGGDFIYLDPPYASRRRNTFGEYGYDCFDEEQLPDLFSLLHLIDRIGATFLLSYCQHAAFAELPARWHKSTLTVRRHVAGFAHHRRTVRELLVSNCPLLHSQSPQK